MKNYLVKIIDTARSEERFITVYASDEDAAGCMGARAADLMEEEFHKGRSFYVDELTALE